MDQIDMLAESIRDLKIRPTRACSNCMHKRGKTCMATMKKIEEERTFEKSACGKSGNLWEYQLEKSPGWIRRLWAKIF